MTKTLSLLAAATMALASPLAHAQDAKAGETKAAMCIGCHGIPGYQASFPQVHRVPMIAGQNARYIEAALQAYRKGERSHPSMRGLAGSLTDKDISDLAAFYQQQAGAASTAPDTPAAASPEVAALLTKGACASCHGANYSKPIDPGYPKIAGQHADYLFVAMRAYQAKDPKLARGNAIMVGQVAQFKPAELRAIANYLGSLPGDLKTVAQPRFR